jgi:hypothetical protein
MAFPASPSNNQVHKEGNRSFVYDSTLGVWDQIKEIDRSSLPSSSGSSVPIETPKIITNQMILTPGIAPAETEGAMYYNDVNNVVKVWSGSAWDQLSNKFTATGGTESTYTSSGTQYKVHTFTSSGTFTIGTAYKIDLLLVAGGGAGSADGSTTQGNGGGGAGGMYEIPGRIISSGSYSLVVGAGGVGALSRGTNGVDSTGFGFTAGKGGVGGLYNNAAGYGGTGYGSGGGGGYTSGNGGAHNNFHDPLSGTNYHYGYEGAAGSSQGGGGGGGAGAAGSGRNAGAGRNNNWRTGSNIMYAGGGGGGKDGYYGTASGGGGSGNGGAGTVNTGGGGAGGQAGTTSGNGGSGIIIIRYTI